MNLNRPDLPDAPQPPENPPAGGWGERPGDASAQAAIRAARARYEKGLLAWLRQAGDASAGLEDMHTALARIEAEETSPSSRCFWRIARGCIDALSAPTVSRQPGARQLCAHLDIQMRRHQAGDRRLDDGLLQETLAFISRVPAGASPAVDRIRANGDLDAFPLPFWQQDDIPELTEACTDASSPGDIPATPATPGSPGSQPPSRPPDYRAALLAQGEKIAYLRTLAQAVADLKASPATLAGDADARRLSLALAEAIDGLEELRQALWGRMDGDG